MSRSCYHYRFSFLGWICLSLTALPSFAQQPPSPLLPTLTTVAAVRNLSPSEADRAYPVHLNAVVTLFNHDWRLLFVQDATAGIYLFTEVHGSGLMAGDEVTVEGKSKSGLFSPVIDLPKITRIRPGPLPPPRPVPMDVLQWGQEDSQWIQVEGHVYAQETPNSALTLHLASGHSRLKTIVFNTAGAEAPDYLGAQVNVQGILGSAFDSQRKLLGFHLYIPSTNQIQILGHFNPDPFTAPLRTSDRLLQFSPAGNPDGRVRIQGSVLLHWPAQAILVKDDAGPILIQSTQPEWLQPGEIVEAVGFPETTNNGPSLTEAIFRRLEPGKPPAPIRVSTLQAAAGNFWHQWVIIEARLLAINESPDYEILLLESSNTAFRLYRMKRDPQFEPAASAKGSLLRVKGLCAPEPSQAPASDAFVLWGAPGSSPVFVSPPPKPPAEKNWIIAAALLSAFALASAALWNFSARKTLKARFETVRAQETSSQTQLRDLADNSNDILFTHDLTGRITSLNKTGQEILGYTSSEALSLNINDLMMPHYSQNTGFYSSLETGSPSNGASAEVIFKTKNHQQLILEIRTRLLHRHGRLDGFQAIARDVSSRKKLEQTLKEKEQDLKELLVNQEKLACALHDGTIQSIYAVGLKLEDCRHRALNIPDDLGTHLTNVREDLNTVIRDVRNFIKGLKPEVLKGQEFKAAIKSLILTLGDTHAARFQTEIDSHCAENLDSKVATHLLHIAREAISNTIRHAQAQTTLISLQSIPNSSATRFEVRDDGAGFNLNTPEHQTNGNGLKNIALRAKAINADFKIISSYNEGTRIVLDIPHPQQN